VDEGNNWVNIGWGPLALTNPVTGATLGNYALAHNSPAIDYVPKTSPTFSIAPTTDFYGNPRPDPTVKNYFDIGAVEFQGSNIPTLTSITPNSGYRGNSYAVTLIGTDLTNGTVNVPAGITVSNTIVVNSTTITATFTIATYRTLGATAITVTAPGGTSNSVPFTVLPPPPPTLATINPASALRGTAASITLTGTNFMNPGTTVTVANTGVKVTGVTVVNSTTITATFTPTLTATLGATNVTVTTAGGTSNALTFTVLGPQLTSIAPATGQRATSVSVTLTGVGFTGATAINVSGTGVSASGLTVGSDTQITATFTITATAGLGNHNVSVTAPGGTTGTVTFNVTNPPPVPAAITSPTPGSTLTSSTAVFTWTAGTLVTQYSLHVGTTGAGSTNIFGGTVTGGTKTVTGIPTTGGTLYVRLYSMIGGVWQYIDYTYTEANPVPAPATITSPTAGSTLSGSAAVFTWTAGVQVTQYSLHVGTTGPGSTNVFGGTVTGGSKNVTGIPTTGGTLYVRLYSMIGGVWQYIDYTYTEQ